MAATKIEATPNKRHTGANLPLIYQRLTLRSQWQKNDAVAEEKAGSGRRKGRPPCFKERDAEY
jgi:hypothetical protein